jgi:hypothetical protein
MTTTRSSRLGPDARPVAVPEDLADAAVEKAAGNVELPLHVRWSGPSKFYDLADRGDRVRVYEQVLREGNADDIRRFIDVEELIALWDDLVLTRAGPGSGRRSGRPTRRRSPISRSISEVSSSTGANSASSRLRWKCSQLSSGGNPPASARPVA